MSLSTTNRVGDIDHRVDVGMRIKGAQRRQILLLEAVRVLLRIGRKWQRQILVHRVHVGRLLDLAALHRIGVRLSIKESARCRVRVDPGPQQLRTVGRYVRHQYVADTGVVLQVREVGIQRQELWVSSEAVGGVAEFRVLWRRTNAIRLRQQLGNQSRRQLDVLDRLAHQRKFFWR